MHLQKLSVGSESIRTLADWQKTVVRRRKAKGLSAHAQHVTRLDGREIGVAFLQRSFQNVTVDRLGQALNTRARIGSDSHVDYPNVKRFNMQVLNERYLSI